MTQLISRKQAKEQGLIRYFTGKPCREGHVAERQTNNGACCACAATKAAEWRSKNPERSREIHKKYRAMHRELVRTRDKVYKERRKEKAAARRKVYDAENAEKIAAQRKIYIQNNKAKFNAYKSKRRAQKIQATPVWYSEFDELVMEEAHDVALLRENITGVKWDVDHMIPLQAKAACGFHCAANVQVIPATLNASKSNRMIMTDPLEWLTRA